MRFMLVIATVLLSLSNVTFALDDVVEVWDFDEGLLNNLDGGYNHFIFKPANLRHYLSVDNHRGSGGRSLQIHYSREEVGACGVWMHLFDSNAEKNQRTFYSADDYPYVSFWVRGEQGGEDFDIQIADKEWLDKEDSVVAGPVGAYLKDGVTTEWQEVVIPIKDAGLNGKDITTLTLNFAGNGNGTVYVDDVYLKKTIDAPVPESNAGRIRKVDHTQFPRAMWVWDTKQIVISDQRMDDLLAFCKQQNVDELFLQVIYVFENDKDGNTYAEMVQPHLFRKFIKKATESGIRIHALDGYPEYALKTWHHKTMAIIDCIIDYNESSEPDERFYGVHLDNEPYQIMGFDGPQREPILVQLLEINDAMVKRIKERGSDLVFGIDIPFWFDEAALPCVITYNGKTQDAAKHLIEICDNVGIMDYRITAGGYDGIVYHALGEIEHADKVGKKIYIGVETFRYEPIPLAFVYGIPEADWHQMTETTNALFWASNVNDFRARSITDEKRRYLGIAEPIPMRRRNGYIFAMKKLYKNFGATNMDPEADLEQIRAEAEKMIEKNIEYDGFEELIIKDDDGNIEFAGFKTTEYMPDKITFAGTSKEYLETVLQEVAQMLGHHPSFNGYAIHYDKTYKELPDTE